MSGFHRPPNQETQNMSITAQDNSAEYNTLYYGRVLPQPLPPAPPPFHVAITHAPYPAPVHYGTHLPPYYPSPHPPIFPSYQMIPIPIHALYNQPPSPIIFRNRIPLIVPIYPHLTATNIQHGPHPYPHLPGIPPPLPASTISTWNRPIPPKPLPVLTPSSPLPAKPQTVSRSHPWKPNATHTSGRRSQWVMWIGNVPPDATEIELWYGFSRIPIPAFSSSPVQKTGLLSVHVLAKSHCAFANYESELSLNTAITRFNGQSCRPKDLGCPPMVCRVRRMDDNVKRGAKAQEGMHFDWIRKQNEQTGGSAMSRQDSVIASPTEEHDNDDASCSSSFLNRHFPSRYFLLKSLTRSDLNISVENGVWATQRHNEETLDRAYRTSDNVYLIFGANKSREFFGYARMIGPIFQTRNGPPEADIGASPYEVADLHPSSGDKLDKASVVGEYPPTRFGRSIPLHLLREPSDESVRPSSAPAALGSPRSEQSSYFEGYNGFASPSDSPISHPAAEDDGTSQWKGKGREWEEDRDQDDNADANEDAEPAPQMEGWEQWGHTFPVEWMRVQQVPFSRTRHLRNPWNGYLEIKVSRDGTELEPSVGKRLLEEWDHLAEVKNRNGG